VAPVVAEPMDGARGVLQRKFDGRKSGVARHLTLPCRHGSPRQGLTVATVIITRVSRGASPSAAGAARCQTDAPVPRQLTAPATAGAPPRSCHIVLPILRPGRTSPDPSRT
jgi:hypothetical protein